MKIKRKCKFIGACSSLFLIVAFIAAVNGQATDEKWIRIAMDNGEVSLAMPDGFVVDAEKRDGIHYRLFGFRNGVMMTVKVTKQGDAKKRLEFATLSGAASGETFAKGDIKGKRFSSDKSQPYFHEKIYLASDKYFYVVEIKTGDRRKAEIAKFFNSLNIEGRPLFRANGSMPPVVQETTFGALRTSDQVLEAFSQKPGKNKVRMVTADPADSVVRYQYDGLSRPAIILDEPRPRFSPGGIPANGFPVSGKFERTALLEVTFRADGTVGDITAYSNADKSYLEACKAAAQKIRFIPAQINGKYVDSKDIINYSIVGVVSFTTVMSGSIIN